MQFHLQAQMIKIPTINIMLTVPQHTEARVSSIVRIQVLLGISDQSFLFVCLA